MILASSAKYDAMYPADTDVLKTSLGCLKKVTMSYNQTRRLHDVLLKASDLGRLADVRFMLSTRRLI